MDIEVLGDKLNSLVDEVHNNTSTVTNAYNESLRSISNYILESVPEDKKEVANTIVGNFLKLVIEYSDYVSKKVSKNNV